MRPIYETNGDIQRQIDVLESLPNHRYKLLPKLAGMDAILIDQDNNLAVAEVKDRTANKPQPSTLYPTYMISLKKVREAQKYIDMNIDAFLIVKWSDRTVWLPFDAPHTEGWGGRWDRGDKRDKEKVCFYDAELYRDLDELTIENNFTDMEYFFSP